MSAPHGPGPEEGRGVAARLVYDPNIATVSEETFNELIAIMRITVTIIDGGERQLFNQPLFSGLATCKPGPHFGDLAPLCCHHFGREAAHGVVRCAQHVAVGAPGRRLVHVRFVSRVDLKDGHGRTLGDGVRRFTLRPVCAVTISGGDRQ